jgi:hypothetical protein
MKLAKILIVLSMLIVMACTHTSDIKAKSGYDASVDFSKLSTYVWHKAAGVLNDPNGVWIPTDLDVKSELTWLVDKELGKRGFTKIKENPDVFVVMGIVVDMENQEALVKYREGIETLFTLPKGALFISLVDAKSNKVIWAGEAESQIKNNTDHEKIKKRLANAVSKIFKDFPR